MKGYVYNADSNEIIFVIEADSNMAIENKASELGYMGMDEYGVSYTDAELVKTSGTEYLTVI